MVDKVRSAVQESGYAISTKLYCMPDMNVIKLPVNVFAYKYKDNDEYRIEFDEEQYDWYVNIPHKLGRCIPKDASIMYYDWDEVDSYHGDLYGEGVGFHYLFYKTNEHISVRDKCIIIDSDGEVNTPNEDNIVELNKSISSGESAVIKL